MEPTREELLKHISMGLRELANAVSEVEIKFLKHKDKLKNTHDLTRILSRLDDDLLPEVNALFRDFDK